MVRQPDEMSDQIRPNVGEVQTRSRKTPDEMSDPTDEMSESDLQAADGKGFFGHRILRIHKDKRNPAISFPTFRLA